MYVRFRDRTSDLLFPMLKERHVIQLTQKVIDEIIFLEIHSRQSMYRFWEASQLTLSVKISLAHLISQLELYIG